MGIHSGRDSWLERKALEARTTKYLRERLILQEQRDLSENLKKEISLVLEDLVSEKYLLIDIKLANHFGFQSTKILTCVFLKDNPIEE